MSHEAKFILVTGGRFRSEVRTALQSQYALRKVLCTTVLVREGEPEPDFDVLKRYPGYVIVDAEQPPAGCEPWQTFAVESGGCHSRMTLIKGTGLGKTTMAKALQQHLSGRGIGTTAVNLDEVHRSEILALKESNRVIAMTNRSDVCFEPAFTITVEGGQPFPGMHRL